MKRLTYLSLFLVFIPLSLIKGAEDVRLSHVSTSQRSKIIFDAAVSAGNVDKVISMLTSETTPVEIQALKYSYSLAIKLYKILMDETTGEDFTEEAHYVPIDKIIYVAKELAREGGNDRFLNNMP